MLWIECERAYLLHCSTDCWGPNGHFCCCHRRTASPILCCVSHNEFDTFELGHTLAVSSPKSVHRFRSHSQLCFAAAGIDALTERHIRNKYVNIFVQHRRMSERARTYAFIVICVFYRNYRLQLGLMLIMRGVYGTWHRHQHIDNVERKKMWKWVIGKCLIYGPIGHCHSCAL